jgi:hypothetical protein
VVLGVDNESSYQRIEIEVIVAIVKEVSQEVGQHFCIQKI